MIEPSHSQGLYLRVPFTLSDSPGFITKLLSAGIMDNTISRLTGCPFLLILESALSKIEGKRVCVR